MLLANKFSADLVVAAPDHSTLVHYTSCIIQNDGKFVWHITPDGKTYATIRDIKDGALKGNHRSIDDNFRRAIQYPAQ